MCGSCLPMIYTITSTALIGAMLGDVKKNRARAAAAWSLAPLVTVIRRGLRAVYRLARACDATLASRAGRSARPQEMVMPTKRMANTADPLIKPPLRASPGRDMAMDTRTMMAMNSAHAATESHMTDFVRNIELVFSIDPNIAVPGMVCHVHLFFSECPSPHFTHPPNGASAAGAASGQEAKRARNRSACRLCRRSLRAEASVCMCSLTFVWSANSSAHCK